MTTKKTRTNSKKKPAKKESKVRLSKEDKHVLAEAKAYTKERENVITTAIDTEFNRVMQSNHDYMIKRIRRTAWTTGIVTGLWAVAVMLVRELLR